MMIDLTNLGKIYRQFNVSQCSFKDSLPRQSLKYSDDNRSLPLEPAPVGKAQTVAAHIRT
jgi:hypothetical protein